MKDADKHLVRKSKLLTEGYNFKKLVERVAELFGIERKDALRQDKQQQTVKARSLLCFWLNQELGMTTVDISGRLKISQSAVSKSSLRGQKIERKTTTLRL